MTQAILRGRKQIAAHKGVCVRTIDYWIEKGLPVWRHTGQIEADPRLIDQWVMPRKYTPGGRARSR